MNLTSIEGWQAGLFAGAAFTVTVEAIVRAILHWKRHHKHGHCSTCEGCLDVSGARAQYACEHLRVCPECGDTAPPSRQEEGFHRLIEANTPELELIARLQHEAWEQHTLRVEYDAVLDVLPGALPPCPRCGKPVSHPSQIYCGAACSVQAESEAQAQEEITKS